MLTIYNDKIRNNILINWAKLAHLGKTNKVKVKNQNKPVEGQDENVDPYDKQRTADKSAEALQKYPVEPIVYHLYGGASVKFVLMYTDHPKRS